MNTVIIITVVTLLISIYYLRNFFVHRGKLQDLAEKGVQTQGQLVEVRNLGLQKNSNSNVSEIAVKFETAAGKPHIVRHRKVLETGEVIPVGSSVDLTYLEADPNVCNIPSIGKVTENKWTSLAMGLFILVAGLFIAYIVFINIGTV
ncbi:MAG: DUF3592 domain-containing protein [Spirosomataceae bacterium]